jgi:7-carboxy-7-deazaguanine synthase
MTGLRLTDLYPSLQGEGPRVGDPTTFIRFGGCNMRCPGWPCDTPYAIEPSIWKNDPILTPEEILERIEMLPFTRNMCITGGEPTLQPTLQLAQFAALLLDRAHTIDVFTNGSQTELPGWMFNPLVSVILDWKLRGSGEGHSGRITRARNVHRRLGAKDWIKLVVTDKDDFDEAIAIWKEFRDQTPARWCVGSAWKHISEAQLVEMVLEEGLPWRVNVQVHKYIFDENERQI